MRIPVLLWKVNFSRAEIIGNNLIELHLPSSRRNGVSYRQFLYEKFPGVLKNVREMALLPEVERVMRDSRGH